MDAPIFDVIPAESIATNTDSRRYIRASCSDAALLTIKGIGDLQGRIINASQTGLLIELSKKPGVIQEGHPVVVNWTIPPELGIGNGNGTTRLKGFVARQGPLDSEGTTLAVKFPTTIPEQIQQSSGQGLRWALAALATLTLAAVALPAVENYEWFWYNPAFQAYSLLFVAYITFRIGLCLLYKAPEDKGYMPTVSIIVPAMNEEQRIPETLAHCFNIRYPMSRYEVIVVDDGSTDNTWNVLQDLRQHYPHLRLFRFAENHGKHHAMALGIRHAQGDILIFVDSDSLVDSESVYRIVQPFTDIAVGAVAGHVKVAMPPYSFISRMESVHYFLSHRINKAAESIFGAVTCCPGAFSAYRRDLVLQVLPTWLKHTFMGGKVMLGDDRALTNCILKTHKILYHNLATARTYVPRTWRQFFKQQLRWKKSWLQETRIAMQYMASRHPVMALTYYAEITLTIVSPLVMTYVLFYLPFVSTFKVAPYLFSLVLLYAFFGLFQRAQTKDTHWYFSLILMPFYLTVLTWQNYYAILTIHRNKWSTR